MISTRRFANKLRELGYTFKGESRKSRIWRLSGDGRRIVVPKVRNLAPTQVRHMLRQAGIDQDEIERFIGDASV